MKQALKRSFFRLVLMMTLIVSSCLSVNSGGLRAQNGIGFVLFSGMPDTAYSGTFLNVVAGLKNFSNNTALMGDTVQVVGYIDTTGGHVPLVFPPVDSVNCAMNDTTYFVLPINFLDNYMGGNFRIGNNTIVIWPVCYNPSFYVYDTLRASVFVIDTITGLGPEYGLDEGVHCYPVPASGPLFIASTNPLLHPKELLVRDAAGRIVLVSKTPQFGIETDSWADGVYFLEITFENGSRRIYKVVK